MDDRLQIAIGATGPINMGDIGEEVLDSPKEEGGVEDDGGWLEQGGIEQGGFEIDLTGFIAYTGRYQE